MSHDSRDELWDNVGSQECQAVEQGKGRKGKYSH